MQEENNWSRTWELFQGSGIISPRFSVQSLHKLTLFFRFVFWVMLCSLSEPELYVAQADLKPMAILLPLPLPLK